MTTLVVKALQEIRRQLNPTVGPPQWFVRIGKKMDWIFLAFIVAATVHVVEEFVFPGSFFDHMKEMHPRFAPLFTARFAVVLHILMFILFIAAAIIGMNNLAFSLSIASLLFTNGMIHILRTIITKEYVPGFVSSILLYVPLSVYSYYAFVVSGRLTPLEGIISGILGVIYQVSLIGYCAISTTLKRV